MSLLINTGPRHTHSDRLERWLGADRVRMVSDAMRNWYGPPIAMFGVPGSVYAAKGGDFIGPIDAGAHACKLQRLRDILQRERRLQRYHLARSRRQSGAWASYSAMIAAASDPAKSQFLTFSKTGVASNAIGNSIDLWTRAGMPTAGAAGAAAPGGTAPTSASTGALAGYRNAITANSNHFIGADPTASVIANTLLLYDRIFAVAKTMNSTATEAVTGVPTRYQSTTPGDVGYCGGNFCFPSNPTTVLPATAHNWTVCQYTDQGGNTAQSFPSIAGVSACVVGGVDLVVGNWFMPLATGDSGVKALTQMQCSAAVATGTIDFVMGHPIAIMPCPVANMTCTKDGVNTAFNQTIVLDGACLAFMEINKPATTATNYNGIVQLAME